MINLFDRLRDLESSYDFYYYLSNRVSEENEEIFKSLRDSLSDLDDGDIFDSQNYLIISWQVGKKEGGNCWNQDKHSYLRIDNVIPPLYLLFNELKGNEISSIATGSKEFFHIKKEYYGNEEEYKSMVIPVEVINWIYEFALNEVIDWSY